MGKEIESETKVLKFDKSRYQINTNDKDIIKKLNELDINAYGYMKQPKRSKLNGNIITGEYISLFIYLINQETLENLQNIFNGKIAFKEENKNARKKKSK
jgi:hypothetical protein